MSRLAYIALGACAATIIVLVAMSRKGAADEDALDAELMRRAIERIEGRDLSDFTLLSDFMADDWATDAYPAGLVRHG